MISNSFCKKLLSLCQEKNLPFFCYRESGGELRFGVQCGGDVLQVFSIEDQFSILADGFLVMPFDEKECGYFIRSDYAFLSDDESLSFLDAIECQQVSRKHYSDISIKETLAKEEYINKVSSLVDRINCGEADKVVFSRFREEDFNVSLLPDVFETLLEMYSSAFIFCFNVPGVSMWMGATPELLLKRRRDELCTVALAGTVSADCCDECWSKKNMAEHVYVSDYIYKVLKSECTGSISVNGPCGVKSGGVAHLKTEFAVNVCGSVDAGRIISRLHPTPAVCGCPAAKAAEIIAELEQGSRGFYGGVVGFKKNDDRFSFYVNLRSMECFQDKLRLYAGGGITADSDPEEEWEETELKLKTMFNAIEKCK